MRKKCKGCKRMVDNPLEVMHNYFMCRSCWEEQQMQLFSEAAVNTPPAMRDPDYERRV